MPSALDPRISGLDWDARRAAPVAKLCDTHVHFNGDIKNLETYKKLAEKLNIECASFISPSRDISAQVIKDYERFFTIGKDLIPYARIDMRFGEPDQIQAAYDNGHWGIKCIYPNHSYDDHFYDSIYAKAQELGMPLLFHTGLLGRDSNKPSGSGMSLMRPDTLDTIAARFPELVIQGAHLGNPNVREAILSSTYSDNLYWDASGGIRHILYVDPRSLTAALEHRWNLWDRITFATDTTSGIFRPEHADGWPSMIEYMIACFERIFSKFDAPLTTEQIDNFFYGNARRWYDKIIANRAARH